MTRYRVTHRTEYRYGAELTAGHTIAHLSPRPTSTQRVLHSTLEIDPEPEELAEHLDAFGNRTTYLAVTRPHARLIVTAQSEVELGAIEPWTPVGEPWESAGATTVASLDDEGRLARRFRLDSPLVRMAPELVEYAVPSFPAGRPVDACAVDLMHRIWAEFAFDPDFSDVSTPLDAVLEARRGVCQDFAHLMIGCLRSQGLAARYVSGYLETDPPPGRPKLVGADASHAWCALWVPGHGWLDLDPTNDQVRPARHVTVAWGRDYGDVAPLRGVVFGPPSSQRLRVSVDVQHLPAAGVTPTP